MVISCKGCICIVLLLYYHFHYLSGIKVLKLQYHCWSQSFLDNILSNRRSYRKGLHTILMFVKKTTSFITSRNLFFRHDLFILVTRWVRGGNISVAPMLDAAEGGRQKKPHTTLFTAAVSQFHFRVLSMERLRQRRILKNLHNRGGTNVFSPFFFTFKCLVRLRKEKISVEKATFDILWGVSRFHVLHYPYFWELVLSSIGQWL